MTTIACDGHSMAGDGRTTSNGTIVNDASTKVFKLSDGRIAGFSGYAGSKNDVLAWLNGDREFPAVDDVDLHVTALVMDTCGNVVLIDGYGNATTVATPAALGSGQDIARGAMLAGADPVEAITIAARLDIWTGGTVTVLHK